MVSESVEHGIGIVRIDRPDVHNAFNPEVISGLTASFRRMSERPDVRAVVLTSEGKSFSAGADINWMQSMVNASFDENIEDAHLLHAMLESIRLCPKPVIARVHGAALGGGVGLVAACDLAVALDTATFGLTEVRLGIIPAVISPFVLEKIGPGPARRYFLTAERFGAEEAYRIGLVNHIVSTVDDMDAAIRDWCSCLLQNGPEAVAAAKKLVGDILNLDWNRSKNITVRRIAERRAAAEGQEGMRAFLEKRSAHWVPQ